MNISHGRPNIILFLSVVLLVVVGFAMLASASQVLGFSKFGDSYYFLKNQAAHATVGVVLFVVFYFFPSTYWRRFAVPLYFVGVVLLAVVLIPGVSYGTARSWIQLGGLSVQPSEIMKLLMIFFFAYWFERRAEFRASVSKGLLPFVVYLGVPLALIALQPDVGTMVVLIAIGFAMYVVSGAPWKHYVVLVLVGIVAVGCLIAVAPYRLNRVMVMLNPGLDPQGAGYHAQQAMNAVESGGVLGLGFGKSVSKFQMLPEAPADSIFAIYAEELGFVFVVLLFGLFAGIVSKGYWVANRAPTQFESFASVGIVTWVAVQALVNIGAMVGLLPLTGVPLPFVSYGATALVSLLAAMGFLLNVSKNVKV